MTENMINFLKVRTLVFFPVDLLREPTTWFRILRELFPRKKLLFSSERFYFVLHLNGVYPMEIRNIITVAFFFFSHASTEEPHWFIFYTTGVQNLTGIHITLVILP